MENIIKFYYFHLDLLALNINPLFQKRKNQKENLPSFELLN